MADECRTFQRPETIPVWVEVKTWAGALVNPNEGVKVVITSPDGIVVVTSTAMTNTETGKYVYYYASQLTDPVGWWKAVATVQDGTGAGAKYNVLVGGFQLQ